ncbi:MAG TPA: hypothetical protein DF613_02565 [Lachnospiraceae bacterium]|nr:hypothetical protein [Lachnospiraceae bacterium]
MQVILFDLDGTLTDSGPGIMRSVQYALEKMGRPVVDLQALRCFVGPPLKEQFMAYAGFDDGEALEAIRYYRERYTDKGMFENEVYPGVEDILKLLVDRGRILAVASSKPEVYVRQILDHFGLSVYFREIVGAELNGRTSKSEVIEEALKRLGMSNHRQAVLMVGDRDYDVIGAHHCGLQCIGVSYGYGSREELQKAGAAYVADSVSALAVLAESDEDDETVETNSIDMGNFLEEPVPSTSESRSVRIKPDPREPVQGETVGKKIWRVIYPLLLHFAITTAVTTVGDSFIAIVAIFLLGITDQAEIMEMMTNSVVLLTGVANLVSMPVQLKLIQSDRHRRKSQQYHYKSRPGKDSSASVMLGVVLSSMALCQIINDLIMFSGISRIFPGYDQTSTRVFGGQSIFMLLAVVVIVSPVIEELVFRGLLQQRIRDYLGRGWAIGLTAVTFGIYHGNVVQFIYASLVGVFLGCVLERTQDMRAPIVAHIVANFWSIIGMTIITLILGSGTIASLIADVIMLPVLGVGLWLTFFRAPAR